MAIATPPLDHAPLAMLQAAIRSPSPIERIYEPRLRDGSEAIFEKHEARIAEMDANVASYRRGLAAAITRTAAYLAANPDEKPAALPILEAHAESVSNLIADRSTFAAIDHGRENLKLVPLRFRPRAKRLFDRMRATAEKHHDHLVEQYYRLIALAADCDPASKAVAVTIEPGTDVRAALEALLV